MLSRYGRKIGFSVKIINATDGSYLLQDILKMILKEHTMPVGITAITMNIRGAIQIAKFLKQNLKNEVKISLGGHHINADLTIIERYPFFDFGITGEADMAFSGLSQKNY